MAIFEDRQKAAERKFEHENESAFKLTSRRNKLLGLWAATRMGLAGEPALRYAMTIVESQVTESGDEALIKKIRGDLEAKQIPVTEQDISQQLVALTTKAREELMQGKQSDA